MDKGLSRVHIPFGVKHLHCITELPAPHGGPGGSLLVSSNGTNIIYRVRPAEGVAKLFADTGRLGFKDLGNCVYDGAGSVWAHEIEGCREVKDGYGNASTIGDNRVVFKIKGNDYRLVVKLHDDRGVAYVRFVGTHGEYDRIDAETI